MESSCSWSRGHEGNANCQHRWSVSALKILTYPGRYHQECVDCGRRQCMIDEPKDGAVDMLFYGDVVIKAPRVGFVLESPQTSPPASPPAPSPESPAA